MLVPAGNALALLLAVGATPEPWWQAPTAVEVLTPTSLWTTPLAGPREPRMAAKLGVNRGVETYETSIGGSIGVLRFGPEDQPQVGLQVEAFATVLTRFDSKRALVAADYRVGFPITYASDGWEARVGYEHASSHLGDQLIDTTDIEPFRHVRDEVTFGVARWFFDRVRLYALVGIAIQTMGAVGDNRDRYVAGAEWTETVEPKPYGDPYVAVHVEVNSDQDYTPNTTVQVGWRLAHPRFIKASRLALEFYDGKSPYGQFFEHHETWGGVTVAFDL